MSTFRRVCVRLYLHTHAYSVQFSQTHIIEILHIMLIFVWKMIYYYEMKTLVLMQLLENTNLY